MIFYAIKFNLFPKIKFACSTTTNSYKNIITNRKNIIEIGCSSGGDYIIKWEDKEHLVADRSICVNMPDLNSRNYAVTDAEINLLSVAVEIDDLEFHRYDCSSTEEWECIKENVGDMILIPFLLPNDGMSDEIEKCLREIIRDFMIDSTERSLKCIGQWCQLVEILDKKTREALEKQLKISATGMYIKKAKQYIKEHYAERIKMTDVAAMLKISPSYLCKIFKENTKKSFVEYLNIYRVNKARELMARNPKVTAERLVGETGFCDVRYMNEMFKRYLGVNIRNCRQMDKELSLYHTKPWEIENLVEDSLDLQTEK